MARRAGHFPRSRFAVPDRKNQTAVNGAVRKKDSNAAFRVGKFPRSARLLRHNDFDRVYQQGRRHFSASMTVFYLPRRSDGQEAEGRAFTPDGIRIGFTVGRSLGVAVERNRMKRRLREAARLTRPHAGPDVDVVVNPKKSLLATDFSALLKEFARAFEVIDRKIAENSSIQPSVDR